MDQTCDCPASTNPGLLHPLYCPSVPDLNGVLGFGERVQPYDPDGRRIAEIRRESNSSILFDIPARTDTPAYQAFLETRVWTRNSVLSLAGSPTAIDYYIGQLEEYADYASWYRHNRGEDATPQTPAAAAGTILSYPPGVEIPAALGEVIPGFVRDLRSRNANPCCLYGFSAAVTLTVLGSPDGLLLRDHLTAVRRRRTLLAGSRGRASLRSRRPRRD